MGSYNYLGFAESEGPCADAVKKCIMEEPVAISTPRSEGGTHRLHLELEKLVAEFLGVEDSVVISMGYATNSFVIPAIAGPGTLILSDQMNHSSLVYGCRLSGAKIKVFHHNDLRDLERLLRECIVEGQPRTRRPWKNIWVIVEGLYSMEGNIVRLPKLLELREYYKFYLYVDEAHSIGAMGPRGRGVCDFWGVDPAKVDILMGTFTKSFGAAGGYLAGRKEVIDHIKAESIAYNYTEPLAPPLCAQIITAMKIIMGDLCPGEGKKRLDTIRENSIYFMRELKKMGFLVPGDEGSPIVPVLILNPAKIAAFSREAMLRGVAAVVVGFPATGIVESRVRFCISASHTREDLDKVLKVTSEVGDILRMKYASQWIF
jgi:7-keto-8-aminopelargonate synthetase-like enzyme